MGPKCEKPKPLGQINDVEPIAHIHSQVQFPNQAAWKRLEKNFVSRYCTLTKEGKLVDKDGTYILR